MREDSQPAPMSPYASSKLMSETMLRDASAVSGLKHIILRYFNVAGADPLGRTGQSTKNATHLIKAAVETAVGKRPKIEFYGTITTRQTALRFETTSTFRIWWLPILMPSDICGAEAIQRPSIAVTRGAIRCWT